MIITFNGYTPLKQGCSIISRRIYTLTVCLQLRPSCVYTDWMFDTPLHQKYQSIITITKKWQIFNEDVSCSLSGLMLQAYHASIMCKCFTAFCSLVKQEMALKKWAKTSISPWSSLANNPCPSLCITDHLLSTEFSYILWAYTDQIKSITTCNP